MKRHHREGWPVASIVQTQVRCGGCNRRLADLVNEVDAGQLLIELKCPRCGQPHLEVIRPQAGRDR
jgi:phage FluMu protein Com